MFWLKSVVAIDELKLPILELNPLVVVATDELKELIERVNPLVVVAILELNPFVVVAIEELNPLITVSTLELNAPILVETLELNVEYPVVPVIKTWALPDITDSLLSLFLIVVSIEDVNEFNEPVEVSILVNLPFWVSLVELNDEDKLPILELNPDVVKATLELRDPILELSSDVVVAKEEEK